MQSKFTPYPVLYSFRRCPYAMRARLAIKVSLLCVELREVLLKDKPKEMLACSSKATVPVLQITNGDIIDESLDIMEWALAENDPQNWLPEGDQQRENINQLIHYNDNVFKTFLDHYKYADRYPEYSTQCYREQGEVFLSDLEKRLNQHQYLIRETVSLADIAVFPFIRQFAYVDKTWFDTSEYSKLKTWLKYLTNSPLFNSIMQKVPQWSNGVDDVYFI